MALDVGFTLQGLPSGDDLVISSVMKGFYSPYFSPNLQLRIFRNGSFLEQISGGASIGVSARVNAISSESTITATLTWFWSQISTPAPIPAGEYTNLQGSVSQSWTLAAVALEGGDSGTPSDGTGTPTDGGGTSTSGGGTFTPGGSVPSAWNLSWWKARRFAAAGYSIRRAAWTQWFAYRAGLWWVISTGSSRVLEADDITTADVLAGDWTTRPPVNGCDAANDPQAEIPPAPPWAGLESWGPGVVEPPPAPFYL